MEVFSKAKWPNGNLQKTGTPLLQSPGQVMVMHPHTNLGTVISLNYFTQVSKNTSFGFILIHLLLIAD